MVTIVALNILRKISTLRFNLLLSNGCVTGDRSTKTNDRSSILMFSILMLVYSR